MTGVGVHIPQLCLLRWALRDMCAQPALDPGDSPCDREISYMALPTDLSQDFHPEVQRWQRVTQAAGKPVTLAAQTSWHFAGGQEPAWCNSLETCLQLPTSLLGRSRKVRWGTLYLSCLTVPRNTFSKNDRQPGRELHCLGGCETALALKRKKVMYPFINWALQYGLCKEARAASLRAVFRGGATGSKLYSNKSEWFESKVTGRKTSKKRQKKGSSRSVRSFIVAFSTMTSAIHPHNA